MGEGWNEVNLGRKRMDESVRRAMRRWPDVPDVTDHLGLDLRGRWLLHGKPIEHTRTIAFINRHYHASDDGRWWFQNGPQRVQVQLAYTPWIYRWGPENAFQTHTGLHASNPKTAWLDEHGRLLVETEHGIGLVDDRDLPNLAERIEEDAAPADQCNGTHGILDVGGQHLPIETIRSADVPGRFGFVTGQAPTLA